MRIYQAPYLETRKESFLKHKQDELVSSKTECDVELYNSEDVSDDSDSEPAVESQTPQYELPKNAIGKGRTAAEKCFTILDIPSPVYTWDKHTKLVGDKLEVLTGNSMKDAVLEVKQFMRDCGKLPECPDEELYQQLVNVGTSFDCSWSSRG